MKKSLTILVLGTLLSTGFSAVAQEAEEAAPTPRKPRVGDIRRDEVDRYSNRFQAKDSRIFALGPAAAGELDHSEMMYAWVFGYQWEAGAQGAVDARVTGSFGDKATYLDLMLGGSYFFSDEDISPFLKGGFGVATAKGDGLDWTSGFAAEVGGGVVFFRTSSVHMELWVRHSRLFNKNEIGNPNVTSLTLGIMY